MIGARGRRSIAKGGVLFSRRERTSARNCVGGVLAVFREGAGMPKARVQFELQHCTRAGAAPGVGDCVVSGRRFIRCHDVTMFGWIINKVFSYFAFLMKLNIGL